MKFSKARFGGILAAAGIAGTCFVGLAGPAQANSGQWCSDVWWVTWSASHTFTKIEPHMATTTYPGIGRYTGSGVVYYYGPGVTNTLISHKTSTVSASNGSWVGNYFKHQGIRFVLPSSSC